MLCLIVAPVVTLSAFWTLELELTHVSWVSSVSMYFLFPRRQLLSNLILNDKDNIFISVFWIVGCPVPQTSRFPWFSRSLFLFLGIDRVAPVLKIHQDITQRKRQSPHNGLQGPIWFAYHYDSLVSSPTSLSFVHFAPNTWPHLSSNTFLPQDLCTVLRLKGSFPRYPVASSLPSFSSLSRCQLVSMFLPNQPILISKHTHGCLPQDGLPHLPLFFSIIHITI